MAKERRKMALTRRKVLKLLAAGAAIPAIDSLSLAAAGMQTGSAHTDVPPNAPYKQAHLPIEERVKDLLSRMTLEEKARQLDMYAGVFRSVHEFHDDINALKKNGFKPEQARQLWGDTGVGGIHDLYPSPELSNAIQEWVIKNTRLGIPVMFIEEGLHGFPGGTIFPAPINLGATFNPEIARKTGAAIAAEARANGVVMILAPVLDLAREPRWGRVAENLGEDPYLTGQLGLAYVQGAQGDSLNTDHTLVAEPKHFVGHGSPESGKNTSPVHIGERELRMVMLKSFEPAIREGHAQAVMVGYHEIDGIPMTASPLILIKILRHEWGFQGFTISDLGAIRRLNEDHRVTSSPKESVWLALNSGVDMQFYDFDHDVFQGAIISGMHDGKLSAAALDRAVSAVLRVKFELGLFDRPTVDPSLDAKVRRSQAHLDLSLESARQSMTLLKNEGRLLPLSKSLKRIAVIGPNADVARYGDYADEDAGAKISMLRGITEIVPGATILFDEGKEIPAAVAKAKDAEVVILGLGEWTEISGEGKDRSNLDLPGNQEALLEAIIATGNPVVLVLQNGRPLTIPWASRHVPAILEAWFPAEFGGTAIAETLFGDNNPAGRLAVSFPKTVGQLPDFYNYDPSKEEEYVDGDIKPLYPFGFGLSYTTFGYDNLVVKPPKAHSKDDIVISVDVRNTGTVAGDEVVQLYVREHVTTVETPVKSLKGFSRIHLVPGEVRTATFHLPQDQLAVWNEWQRWVVEPGEITVWVGGSSDATLSADLVLKA
jgi:beta-glucosidase